MVTCFPQKSQLLNLEWCLYFKHILQSHHNTCHIGIVLDLHALLDSYHMKHRCPLENIEHIRPTYGWDKTTHTLVPWRQGFRHPTRNECMRQFAHIPCKWRLLYVWHCFRMAIEDVHGWNDPLLLESSPLSPCHVTLHWPYEWNCDPL